jgi:predicted Zn-dependent protease
MEEVVLVWDSGIDRRPDVIDLAVHAVEMMACASGRSAEVQVSALNGASQIIDNYLEQVVHSNRRQIDAQMLVGLLLSRAASEKTLLVLTSRDLTYPEDDGTWHDYVFGAAHGKTAVIGVHRFLRYDIAPYCAWLLMAHELGHLWGLVPSGAVNEDQRTGLYRGHCKNYCVMQQVMDVPEVLQLARKLRRSGTGLCAECVQLLRLH